MNTVDYALALEFLNQLNSDLEDESLKLDDGILSRRLLAAMTHLHKATVLLYPLSRENIIIKEN